MSARASQVRTTTRKPAKSLRVVPRRSRVRRRGGRRVAPAIAVGAVLIAGTVFAVLLAQVILAQSGFKMAKMREELAQEEERHARLVLKAAKMGSASRIERVAIEELGLVHPTRVEYIVANVRGGTAQRLARQDAGPLLPTDGSTTALGTGAP